MTVNDSSAECARRMKVCFECKAVIQLKEGLRKLHVPETFAF